MKHRGGVHEFALYLADLGKDVIHKGEHVELTNEDLVHRISRVLRLNVDDPLILFDTRRHIYGLIKKIAKHEVLIEVVDISHNKILQPHITLLLPLLKKEALEQAIYSAVELGVDKIQLVQTEKVQRHWQGKELERLQHIMVAAAEQSKSFALPELYEPIGLQEIPLLGKVIFFDAQGEPVYDLLSKLHHQKSIPYMLLIGPEGDLSETEKFYLQQHQVAFACLTPTVLRAQQAVALGVGILRSFF